LTRSSAPSEPLIEWLRPEQIEFHASVQRFALTLPDDAGKRDAEEIFDRDSWNACGRFGIQGLPAPEDFGGGGVDTVGTMLALEALGYGCTDAGLVFSVNAHMWTSVIPLMTYGTPEQKRRWLPGLCDGSLIGCHTVTEPDAGSDAFALRSKATRGDGGWVLQGTKTFITNAPVADLLVVFARSGEGVGPFGLTAFLTEPGTPGLTIGKPLDKLGLRTSPMAEVFLDDLFVPDGDVLGRVGRGGEIFHTSMRWERACIMASQVGLMRRTLERCVAYAKQRKQFG